MAQSIGCNIHLCLYVCVCAIGCIPWESPNLQGPPIPPHYQNTGNTEMWHQYPLPMTINPEVT